MLQKWEVLKKHGYDVKNYQQQDVLKDNFTSSSTISGGKPKLKQVNLGRHTSVPPSKVKLNLPST